jgi:hypothetical protein
MPKEVLFNTFPVFLYPGVKLLRGHTDIPLPNLKSDDYKIETGEVIKNPKDPNRWGLRNKSDSKWAIREPGVEGKKELEPGKPVAITSGMEITFPSGKTVILK